MTKPEAKGELLPCPLPWCCGTAEECHSVEAFVRCTKCGASSNTYSFMKIAVDEWNTRAPAMPTAVGVDFTACHNLLQIVEGIENLGHGTWRDEKSVRLKDTKEWVSFYLAVKDASNVQPAPDAVALAKMYVTPMAFRGVDLDSARECYKNEVNECANGSASHKDYCDAYYAHKRLGAISAETVIKGK